jgi:hypothetical protein
MHADWLEWLALATRRGRATRYEHSRDVELTGSDDAVPNDEVMNGGTGPGAFDQSPEDRLEALVDGVFAELTSRAEACKDAYPFKIDENGIERRDSQHAVVYRFLALLSIAGKDGGPPHTFPERLFERLSAEAAKQYLGGSRAEAEVFGHPRPSLPKAFPAAVTKLSRLLGEGGCYGGGASPRDKDDGLDVVAWRHFPDRKKGKLVLFGQCATGAKWYEERKFSLLAESGRWCNGWMRERVAVDPVRAFFVPHSVRRDQWDKTCRDGGILFERCRIASLVRDLPDALASRLGAWADWVQQDGMSVP